MFGLMLEIVAVRASFAVYRVYNLGDVLEGASEQGICLGVRLSLIIFIQGVLLVCLG